MSKTPVSFVLAVLASLLCTAPVLAQHAPAPAQYTLTQTTSLFGAPMTLTFYRDGQVVVVDHADTGTRSYNDLAHGRSFSWDTKQAAPECGMATFSGDWGDPFGDGIGSELAKLHTQELGTEVVNGIRSRVIEADNPQAGLPKYKMWLDAKYGELVKLLGPNDAGAIATLIETKSLNIGKPAAVFGIPASCTKLAAQPPPPTEAEQTAALTGSAPGKYVKADTGQPSKESCTILFSIVKPKTLAPFTLPVRVGIDAAGIDSDHPPHYIIGEAGKPFFQGGGLHEVTKDFKSGVLRIENVPTMFDIEVSYATPPDGVVYNSSAATATLYRQCAGKSTVKLLLVADPETPGAPTGWVWEK